MGHQARSASGGRSYVTNRHAERVSMPPTVLLTGRLLRSRAGRPPLAACRPRRDHRRFTCACARPGPMSPQARFSQVLEATGGKPARNKGSVPCGVGCLSANLNGVHVRWLSQLARGAGRAHLTSVCVSPGWQPLAEPECGDLDDSSGARRPRTQAHARRAGLDVGRLLAGQPVPGRPWPQHWPDKLAWPGPA